MSGNLGLFGARPTGSDQVVFSHARVRAEEQEIEDIPLSKRINHAARSPFSRIEAGNWQRPADIAQKKLHCILGLTSFSANESLPEEATLTLPYENFFNSLASMATLPFGKPRLEAFISQLELVRDISPETLKMETRGEVWLKREEAYLHLVVGGGPFFSTYGVVSGEDKQDTLFINLAEWKNNSNGGARELAAVQLRVDVSTGSGEWMWIRKNSSFSGSQAVEWAAIFSRLFLIEATMLDVSKLQVGRQIYQLSSWNAVALAIPQSFYSKAGFEVFDASQLQGKSSVYSQNRALHAGAVLYLRAATVKAVASLFKADISRDEKKITGSKFLTLARKYNCENNSLTSLCQAVNSSARAAMQGNTPRFVEQDRKMLYEIVSGNVPFKSSLEGRMLSMATRINGSQLLLKAVAPFAPVKIGTEGVSEPGAFSAAYKSFADQSKAKLNLQDFVLWYAAVLNPSLRPIG